MNNLNHVDLLLTAEAHTVTLADLATDPKMQMRVNMDQVTCPRYLIQPVSSNVVGC